MEIRRVAWFAAGSVALALLAPTAITGAGALNESGQRNPLWIVKRAPATLRLPGESANLRYDLICAAPRCRPSGTAYVRAGTSGEFRAIELSGHYSAGAGNYVARVPAAIASSPRGFQYYVVARDARIGVAAKLPPGGAAAPQRSFLLTGPAAVDLGTHRFGAPRRADRRVLSARWGTGADRLGLERQESGPVGVWVRSDVRVAVVGKAGVEESWRVLSKTWVAGLQLAEPVGDKLVLVFAVFTEKRSEYQVLVLKRDRVEKRFSVPMTEYVEQSWPAFRLAGSSLYKLGSTRAGVFVDRYDLS